MDFLMQSLSNLYSFGLGTLVPFLFVLTIVVFFHELGHFGIARLLGMGVKAFSVGFGPEIIGRTDTHGTRWKLSMIPLGGYVKFVGDETIVSAQSKDALKNLSENEQKTAFLAQSVWKRAAVVAAGPMANFILSIVILTFIYNSYGERMTAPRIDRVVEQSAAEEAGFQKGDVVKEINGKAIRSFSELRRIVSASPSLKLSILVERAEGEALIDVTPRLQEVEDAFGGKVRVGTLGVMHQVGEEGYTNLEYSLPESVIRASQETWFIIERSIGYIGGLISGREKADQLSGPIRVAKVSGDVADLGFIPLLQLAAVLSVSIGFINLLPIPMLDGGHLFFYAIEAVRGKPLSEKAQEIGLRIGFSLVIMMMIFATYNDILQLMRS